MLPDFDEQIRNVLSGRSAFGAPGFGQMPVSCGPEQLAIVRHYVTRFCAECTARDDRTRTVLIRKLVGYVVRSGCLGDNDMRLASAVTWFAAHPADVCSPMGITGAARRRQQQLQLARANHKRFARKSHATLESMLGPVRDELSFIIIDGDIVPVDRRPPLPGGGPHG